ncbi:ABC-three component system middle component 1 [Peribacillus sp. NPDC060186]
MIDELISLFTEEGKFLKFTEIDFAYINFVYASPEQLFGISTFETEDQLIDNWEHAADELAVKIQGRLSGELRSLKWDMYLILLVLKDEVQIENRKKIQNNRQYFKKIILTRGDYPFTDKLPITIDIKQENEFILFNDLHFLQELKSHLSQKTVERIGEDFFQGNSTNENFYKKFMFPHLNDRGDK